MKAALRPILELLAVIPGLLLAYFPVKSYLMPSPGRLAARLLPMLSDGMRILLLTIVLSAAAALLFPRREPAEAEAALQEESAET